MKMIVEIPINEIGSEWYDEDALIADIKQGVIDKFIDDNFQYYNNKLNLNVNDLVREIIKENKDIIIDKIVNKVSENIERKKSISALTPKASEITQINKENEEYFLELINKCIAKKFR